MTAHDPNLTRQPSTLDPNVEIPDDAPRGQAQNEDDAAEVKAAHADHKEAVKAEREAEDVGPRKPGDHAEKQTKSKKSD